MQDLNKLQMDLWSALSQMQYIQFGHIYMENLQ